MFYKIISIILLITNYNHITSANDEIEIINGKNFLRKMEKTFFYQPSIFYDYVSPPMTIPNWKASAVLIGDENVENGPNGMIIFRQYTPSEPVVISINATGLPAGRHAVHIHEFGDIKEGCKSTGSHLKHILIGNIDVKDDGNIEIIFHNPYINLFGPRGIIGRSIVIHEKPIEYNKYPDIYGTPIGLQTINPVSFQTEEMIVGTMLACGVITITDYNN